MLQFNLKFTAVIIFTFLSSLSVQALDNCQTLFENATVQTVNLNELYSKDNFTVGPAFREIFKLESKAKIDYVRAGTIWKNSIESLSDIEKNKIKHDLKNKRLEGAQFYNNDFIWNIDLLIMSLEPTAIRDWITTSETAERSYKRAWQLALFIRSFDSKLAHDMAGLAIQIYPQALKIRNILLFNSDLSGYTDIIAGKRALVILIKVFLGLPEKLLSVSKNNQIKLSDLQKETQAFQKKLARQLNLATIIDPQQQFAVLKELQNQIKNYKQLNPQLETDKLYLVLDGSFANGLALTDKSDIDLVISHKSLRDYFADQSNLIQEVVFKAMKNAGYQNNPLRLENIAHTHPQHFTSATSDLNFGFLGTVAYKISTQKIELIVYDYVQSTPHKAAFSTYEIVE